jgi:hypothetical protein
VDFAIVVAALVGRQLVRDWQTVKMFGQPFSTQSMRADASLLLCIN